MRSPRSPKVVPVNETNDLANEVGRSAASDEGQQTELAEAFDVLFNIDDVGKKFNDEVKKISESNEIKRCSPFRRRPSISDGILNHFENMVDPIKDRSLNIDEEITNKSLYQVLLIEPASQVVISNDRLIMYQYLQLAREGDFKPIQHILFKLGLVKAKKIVNQLDSNKISALHYAARYDHLPIVELLVEHGADINIRGDDGLTPLHFCAR